MKKSMNFRVRKMITRLLRAGWIETGLRYVKKDPKMREELFPFFPLTITV